MRLPTRLLLTLLVAGLTGCLPAQAATVASKGDASISHDDGGTWTLTAAGTALKLVINGDRDFSVAGLTTASGGAWVVGTGPDTFVRIGNETLPFGNRSAGYAFQNVSWNTVGERLQLHATYDLAPAGLRVTRHYAITSGSPAFETWTTYTPVRDTRPISDLNGLWLTVPNGQIRWLTGLMGDSSDFYQPDAFTLLDKTLAVGNHLEVGAVGRSSETAVPWFAVDGDHEEFFATLMWSGAWLLDIERTTTGLSFEFGLGPMTTTARQPIDGPHAVFGVVSGGLSRASAALGAYAMAGIRNRRPLAAPVVSNTWFAFWARVDESTIRAEMAAAAALGVEIFVLDAGWYVDAGANGIFDFDSGLGSLKPDPVRFPEGLKPLVDYAHSLGMKFGIWVEPERVNLSLVADREVDELWLATEDGKYGFERTAQICFAGSAGRTWILNRLIALIDGVKPDYLKWDNNAWINCNREGHGHGTTDGNFAHVNGLYDVLAALRARYPNLLMENVSGGGNRLDFEMMRYTDVGWMSDHTAQSTPVRHDIEGLSAVFPPAYLLSFVTNHESEPLRSGDLPLSIRSRMTGAMGLSFKSREMTESNAAELSHEIELYKTMRRILSVATATLLTPQAAPGNGPPWDALQATAPDAKAALIFAFQSDAGVGTFRVKPAGLLPDARYEVESVDSGPLGTSTGAELMANGIDIVRSPTTAAHILIITAKQ